VSRVKKPENETPEESITRKIKETVSNTATRNEKISFDRKMNNMVLLLSQLSPIEDQITELLAKKMPIMDDIQMLRGEMMNSCVHPTTHLVIHQDHVVCKFCDRKFSIPN
jgi:hypothetical protein